MKGLARWLHKSWMKIVYALIACLEADLRSGLARCSALAPDGVLAVAAIAGTAAPIEPSAIVAVNATDRTLRGVAWTLMADRLLQRGR